MPCKSPSSYAFAVAAALVVLFAAASAAAFPGGFDPTFAGDGIVDDGAASEGYGVAIQGDGKILVAAGSDFAVLRYDETGSLDLGFGTAGRATASFGGTSEVARTVAVAPDGKILVAGWIDTGPDLEVAIARFDTTGALDPTFGTGGMTTTLLQSRSAFADTMVRLPSGRIIVGGGSSVVSGVLVAYDDDGNLDAGFGMGGILDLFGVSVGALAVTGDSIVVVGTLSSLVGEGVVIARFGFDGTAGPVSNLFDADSFARAAAVDQRGRVVIAGGANGCHDTYVARVRADGTLDRDFGTDGVTIFDLVPVSSRVCADFGTALALQPDGKILVGTTGQTETFDGLTPRIVNYWYLSRLDPDGAHDRSFDDNSPPVDSHVFLQDAAPNGMAMQADGKVVTVGGFSRPTATSLALTRNEAMAAPICTTAPRNDCGTGGRHGSTLKLERGTTKRAPRLDWCFRRGSATAADFGDPLIGGSYALCLYDGTDALVAMTQVEGGGFCDGEPCWKATGPTGWKYGDGRGTSYGVDELRIKLGRRSAKLCVEGTHANLPLVPLPATLPLRAQLQTSAGSCFDATYGTATKNDANQLSAKN